MNNLLAGLTDEQIAKVKQCNSSAEIFSLAEAEGVELTEEQLEAISGSGCDNSNNNHRKKEA